MPRLELGWRPFLHLAIACIAHHPPTPALLSIGRSRLARNRAISARAGSQLPLRPWVPRATAEQGRSSDFIVGRARLHRRQSPKVSWKKKTLSRCCFPTPLVPRTGRCSRRGGWLGCQGLPGNGDGRHRELVCSCSRLVRRHLRSRVPLNAYPMPISWLLTSVTKSSHLALPFARNRGAA